MNNSRTLTVKNAKFSGYYFYMNLNIWGDFQICISASVNAINGLKYQNQLEDVLSDYGEEINHCRWST